jgi:hypothetical protein
MEALANKYNYLIVYFIKGHPCWINIRTLIIWIYLFSPSTISF